MSRSRRKNPIIGITVCKSEKQDKRIANRKLRAAVRSGKSKDLTIRDVSDVWGFGKDGKQYVDPITYKKELRK